MKRVKIGIIGLSEGNGHPYSWSAIFNGYDPDKLINCPYPVIRAYLSQKNFPEDGLGHLGMVSHIWTQDMAESKRIAEVSLIPNVVTNMEDMIGEVDAILFARDDAENHRNMVSPFIKAGLPIFIDKPLALTRSDAEFIFKSQKFENQIFTCSSLRYAKELMLNDGDKIDLGKIRHIEGIVSGKWKTYAVHVIEPSIIQVPARGELLETKRMVQHNDFHLLVRWENLTAYFRCIENIKTGISISFLGTHGTVTKVFHDSYSCFKSSLRTFVEVIFKETPNIQLNETLEIVEIIEGGTH